MAEKQRPSALPISAAIPSDQQAGGALDLTKLKKTLTKSSLWKANTLMRIESARSAENNESKVESNNDALHSLKKSLLQVVDEYWQAIERNTGSVAVNAPPSHEEGSVTAAEDNDAARQRDLKIRNQYQGMRKALAVQVKEGVIAKRRMQEQEEALLSRDKEISRLQETVAQLQSDNQLLAKRHQDELDGQMTQLVDLQAAYDQFQRQADQLMNELDEENSRLRSRK